ncbi:MAG: hypothetical protein EXR62_03030 [Chloroflexi bacterium]|nr:hypothetical protein [Chloroflexota bacterium]
MPDKEFIQSLQIRQLLSYGESSAPIPLKSLNVLIGPNASGKSNLLQVIGLLQALPKDVNAPIRAGGGIAEWLWKGTAGISIAAIVADVTYRQSTVLPNPSYLRGPAE